MSKHVIYVDTKNEQKNTNQKIICFLFIIHRVILKYIITKNEVQCACKLALSLVGLWTSLVREDSVETESPSPLGSSLEFNFCFAITETNYKKRRALKRKFNISTLAT